jgi:methylated-DNA-[protein]-cysteine S-methyltransferase
VGARSGADVVLTTTTVTSPLGPLLLHAADATLSGLYFEGHRPAPPARPAGTIAVAPTTAPFGEVATQLDEYFAGTRRTFDLRRVGAGTPFQRDVWDALCEIPFGHTVSYGALAVLIGRPTAVRAVAAANARNPLSIVVPCHRVVGAGGSLTGYAGGVERKHWLLAHEASATH